MSNYKEWVTPAKFTLQHKNLECMLVCTHAYESVCFCVGQGCLQRGASDIPSRTLWWGHWRDRCTLPQHESEAQQTNNGRFLPTCRLFRSARARKQADQTHRADKRSTGQTNENDLGLMSHKQGPQLDSISSTWVTSVTWQTAQCQGSHWQETGLEGHSVASSCVAKLALKHSCTP